MVIHGLIKEAHKRLGNYPNCYVFKYMESIYEPSSPAIYFYNGNDNNFKSFRTFIISKWVYVGKKF